MCFVASGNCCAGGEFGSLSIRGYISRSRRRLNLRRTPDGLNVTVQSSACRIGPHEYRAAKDRPCNGGADEDENGGYDSVDHGRSPFAGIWHRYEGSRYTLYCKVLCIMISPNYKWTGTFPAEARMCCWAQGTAKKAGNMDASDDAGIILPARGSFELK